jgi:hypothetical protein
MPELARPLDEFADFRAGRYLEVLNNVVTIERTVVLPFSQ